MRTQVCKLLCASITAIASWLTPLHNSAVAEDSPPKTTLVSVPVANIDPSNPATLPQAVIVPPKSIQGLNFGVGIALTLDIQRQNRVVSADVVPNGPGGIVRITQTDDAIAGLLLESHYFFTAPASTANPPPTPTAPFYLKDGSWGHGPFVAVEAGTNGSNVITAYGLGWMIGFKQPTGAPMSSWNLGVGLRVDPTAKVLGDGIVANAPLPPGETTPVRLKTEPRYGVMIVSSFSF